MEKPSIEEEEILQLHSEKAIQQKDIEEEEKEEEEEEDSDFLEQEEEINEQTIDEKIKLFLETKKQQVIIDEKTKASINEKTKTLIDEQTKVSINEKTKTLIDEKTKESLSIIREHINNAFATKRKPVKRKIPFQTLWEENEYYSCDVKSSRDIIVRKKRAWLFFLMDNKKKGESCSEAGTRLSEKWKNLTPEAKKPYQIREEKDALRFERETKKLNKNDIQILDELKRTKRQLRKQNLPKKPMSAYRFFVQEVHPQIKQENPNFTFSDVGKELGRRWKAVDSVKRAEYKKKAEKELEVYQLQKKIKKH